MDSGVSFAYLALSWLALAPILVGQTKTKAAPAFEMCERIGTSAMIGRAAAGNPEGKFCVGYYYMVGYNGARKDPAEGAKYIREAADLGYLPAIAQTGRLYKHGVGLPTDYREAERWMRKAAELGYAPAQVDLAVLYLQGREGVPKNRKEAIRWVELAMAQNDPAAFNLLTTIKILDQARRVEPAQELFEEGKRIYLSGDRVAAVKPFMAAATAGNRVAQLQIGWHYEHGIGVPQNYVVAAGWYGKAAAAGDSAAMTNLGNLYEAGNGEQEDWVEAARWWRKSAELAYVRGEAALSRAYQFGIGVPQNRSLSIIWGARAADLDDPESAYFAKWLKDPTNNIGFRDDRERSVVLNGRLRFGGTLIGGDPAGILFRNSSERMAWLAGQRRQLDAEESRTMWDIYRREYDECRRDGGSNCRDPGPPPER
jgi:TPR repeat protein